MVRNNVVLLFILAVVALGGAAAHAAGLSGTLGVEATFLPGFATDVWLDLAWDVDGWSFGSLLEVAAFPAFAVSWTGTVDYSLGAVDLGGAIGVDIVPFAFALLDLSAGVDLFDVADGAFSALAAASALLTIYPALGVTVALDVDVSYGIFSAWADLDLAIPGFDAGVEVAGEVRVLDLDLDGAGLTADFGASTFLVPGIDAQLWFDVAFVSGAVTMTADTDFDLTPFGLLEQRLEIEIGFDGISAYVWASYTGAGVLSVGAGGTLDFP